MPLVLEERRAGEESEELPGHQDVLEPTVHQVLTENKEQLDEEDIPEPEVWPAQTDHQDHQEKPAHPDQPETPDNEDHPGNPDTEDQVAHQDHEVLQAQPYRSISTHQRHCHPRDPHTDHQSTTTTTTTTTTNTITPFRTNHESTRTWICSISSMA